jgi:hypothetical protein
MSRRNPPTVPAAPLFPGDRATAPMALEESGESAWARFEALQKQHEVGFQKTELASRPPGFDATQPLDSAPRVPPGGARAAPVRQVTLEEVMTLARRNNRACPVPEVWPALHRLLPVRQAGGRSQAAPPPVDGPAWAATSGMQKRLRLRDQIEWAEREAALPVVYDFLLALPEEQWHHLG